MRGWSFAAVGLLVLAASPAARADEASRLGTAREIVAATHAADNMRAIFPTLIRQFRPMLLQQSGGDAKTVDAVLQATLQRFDSGATSFVDLLAGIYAKEFSDDDLNALLAFYRTPAGQHLIGKQVIITKAMGAAGQEWGRLLAKQVLADVIRQKRESAPNL